MSRLYDTLVTQMDTYKEVLNEMVIHSRSLMSNIKAMLQEEGYAIEQKNIQRIKPVEDVEKLVQYDNPRQYSHVAGDSRFHYGGKGYEDETREERYARAGKVAPSTRMGEMLGQKDSD